MKCYISGVGRLEDNQEPAEDVRTENSESGVLPDLRQNRLFILAMVLGALQSSENASASRPPDATSTTTSAVLDDITSVFLPHLQDMMCDLKNNADFFDLDKLNTKYSLVKKAREILQETLLDVENPETRPLNEQLVLICRLNAHLVMIAESLIKAEQYEAEAQKNKLSPKSHALAITFAAQAVRFVEELNADKAHYMPITDSEYIFHPDVVRTMRAIFTGQVLLKRARAVQGRLINTH